MNPFLESPNKLRKTWKNLREDISRIKNDNEVIKIVLEWWSQCPESKPYQEWNNPSDWLTPWEIIHQKIYCKSCISFMIERTLVLSDETRWKDRLQLWWVKDLKNSDIYLMLVVDSCKVINYNFNQVEDIKNVLDNIKVFNKYILEPDEGYKELS